MAIDLLNRFTGTKVNNAVTSQTGSQAATESVEAARIVRSVYAMKAGDTLQGELLSAKGTDITLLLGNTVTLSARLDKELSLTPGQLMSFTVNSNKGGKLSLSPLFANTGMEQNAIKALDAAGIPLTDKSLAMAEELMKQGMPINKQTLSTVFRQMGMFPEAEIGNIVMLNKMSIPVNSENISMMHMYQTNEQYLFSDLQGLGGQIAEMLTDMAGSGQMDSAAAFIKGFLQIFSSGQESLGEAGLNGADTQEIHQNGMPGNTAETVAVSFDGMTKNGYVSDALGKIEENGSLPEVLTDKEIHKGESAAQKVIISENTNPTISDVMVPENASDKEAELLKMLYSEGSRTTEGKYALTQSLFSLLKEQLLMKPESITSAEYVKEFYEQLDAQMGKLQELLKSTGKENSSLSKEVSTIKSNIQFMNQINELYHYVQLPIKMNNAQAKGDLYVYKRKQSKSGDDGKLTALLHLSMPTLGNMDVFLSLEEQKLSTRFCMEKEEMIDFIEAHIDQLNERLMKKGYQVQTNVTAGTKEEKTVIENIMESEQPIPIMTSQSFDARC